MSEFTIVPKDKAEEVRAAEVKRGRKPSDLTRTLAEGHTIHVTHNYKLARSACSNPRSYLRRQGFRVRGYKDGPGDSGYLWAEKEEAA